MLRVEPELGREEPRRLLAMTVVWVTEVERAPRQTMKREHEKVGPAMPDPIVVDALRERLDVGGIVVEAIDRAQRRHPAHLSRVRVNGIERGGRRARRVLRVERDDEDALAAGPPQFVHGAGDCRAAVTHRELDYRQVRRQP